MDPGEQALFSAVSDMLGDRGYLFPLAAAQRQFRDAYYGMSAAALLEDLFFDTFDNFLRQNRPKMLLERPPRGKGGWDYKFEGTEISHKVGKGPTEIAALWDATRKDTVWSFESAILFTSSDYAPRRADLVVNGQTVSLAPITGAPDEPIAAGMAVVAVNWHVDGQAEVLEMWTATEATTVTDLVDFEDVWGAIAEPLTRGAAANTMEVFKTTSRAGARALEAIDVELLPSPRTLTSHGLRPGVYVLAKELLQNVAVKANNRALLLAKETVAEKMRQAQASGLFAPLPTWFAAWAPVRPPNLYLTQRAQFDEIFSGL